MDPQTVFCLNFDCPASGQVGRGTLDIHSRKEHRCVCHVCHQTFAETTGTLFYRVPKPREAVTVILTLLAHGGPVQTVGVAYQMDERTVKALLMRVGQHCERPHDLGQVEADEIHAKMQKVVVWLAMALQVRTDDARTANLSRSAVRLDTAQTTRTHFKRYKHFVQDRLLQASRKFLSSHTPPRGMTISQ